MIVIDASVLSEVLLDRGGARSALEEAQRAHEHEPLHAPAVIEPETLNVLRKAVFRGLASPRRATEAVSDLTKARLVRYPHGPLVFRIWELRDQLTAYDAAYVALAEVLGDRARLLTGDKRLAKTARALLGANRVSLAS